MGRTITTAELMELEKGQSQTPTATKKIINTAELQQLEAQPEQKSLKGFGENAVKSLGASLAGAAVGIPTLAGDVAQRTAKMQFGTPQQKIDTLIDTVKTGYANGEATVKRFVDRYGGFDKFLETAYTDPVGVAVDFSTLAWGAGKAIQGAGTASNMANVANVGAKVAKVGELTNPVAWGAKGTAAGVSGLAGATNKLLDKGLGLTFGKSTKSVIDKLGTKRVFNPKYAQADYIGREIVPKVQDRIGNIIKQQPKLAQRVLAKIGLNKDTAQTVPKLSDKNRLIVSDIIKGKIENPAVIVDKEISIAKRIYNNALQKVKPTKQIFIQKVTRNLKNNLKEMGVIDETGTPKATGGISNSTRDTLLKVWNDLKDGGTINRVKYQQILNDTLESAIGTNDRWNRIVYDTQKLLRQEARRAIPQLKDANRAYAEAMALKDIEKGISKISEVEKMPLRESLVSKIEKLGDAKNYQGRESWKEVLGKKLWDDLDAHLSNRPFGLESSVPGTDELLNPTKAGALKMILRKGAKAYIKRQGNKQSGILKVGDPAMLLNLNQH